MAIKLRRASSAAIAASILFVFAPSSAWAQVVSAYAASCKVDDEIAAPDRSAVDALALAVARNMLGGNGDALRGQMSAAALSATAPSALAQYLKFVALSAPYQNVHVAHTYQIDVKGGRNPLPKMNCGRSLKDPDGVALSMVAMPRQFHVEVAAHTINNDWSIFVWLIPEAGVLKALSVHIDAAAISGRTSPGLRKLALEQVARGHRVNAALLYRAAEGIAGRGPNAVPVWKHDLDKEVSGLRMPSELSGGLEGTWRFANQTFSANDVGVLGVGGNLNLMLVRHTDRWPNDASVDADNRSFVTAVLKDHPEFADSFGAIVVRAMKPDGSGGFGTVYEFGKGFDQDPAGSGRR